MRWLKSSFIAPLQRLCLLILLIFITLTQATAQRQCATIEYNEKLVGMSNMLQRNERFEKWIREKTALRKKFQSQRRAADESYTIPIVVHVIHNGEAVGVGTNLSAAQIQSQIDVLNADFKRLNSDASKTPAEFLPVVGSMNITFVLAKQDPSGLATTGIVRVKGTKTSWYYEDDAMLKALSYWPAEDYFNIWTCKLNNNYLGYTQFPFYNLPGLEGTPDNRLTDGCVIGYNYFGTKNEGAFNLVNRFDLGRTLTHETGHFFGLRHIWGEDSDCASTTDWVDDTPKQIKSTDGCPTNLSTPPSNGCVPSVHTMYCNYLDYTDDACMNMFSAGQVDRMITVLENSTRRATLLTSHGLYDPTPVPNDLSLTSIVSPMLNECSNTITPSIQVKNTGTNTITSSRIRLTIDGQEAETKDFTLNLTMNSTATLTFSTLSESAGNATFLFEIIQTNGVADGKEQDNTLTSTILVSDRVSTPFAENFTSIPSNWIVQNPDQAQTWQTEGAPLYDPANTAASIRYFNSFGNERNEDVLLSPPFNLTGGTFAYLSFDVAYAQTQYYGDTLKVVVLPDCSMDLSTGTRVYYKGGDQLGTTLPTTISFIPDSENDWRKEIIALKDFKNHNNIRIAFVGINGAGNNIYIDNVNILTEPESDLSLTHIINPSIATCDETKPNLQIQNTGTTVVTSFDVITTVNSGSALQTTFNGVSLKPGDYYNAILPALTLTANTNNITFNVKNPNNTGNDSNATNDSKQITTITNSISRIIPLRENFDKGLPDGWSTLNPASGMAWTLTNTNYNSSAYYNAFNNTMLNDHAWLISPLLNFSNSPEASVFFDLSYSFNASRGQGEQLRVLASVGCGNVFDLSLKELSGASLATTSASSSTAWRPSVTSDWARTFVDLTAVAGNDDVRIAFVVDNANGNNIYIDNLEFYSSNNPSPLETTNKVTAFYKKDDPTLFYLKFNLDEQQDVEVEIVDMMGRLLQTTPLQYILNQTSAVALANISTGIYLVRVHTSTDLFVQKVIIEK